MSVFAQIDRLTDGAELVTGTVGPTMPPSDSWPKGRRFVEIPNGTVVSPGLTRPNGTGFLTPPAALPIPQVDVPALLVKIAAKLGVT